MFGMDDGSCPFEFNFDPATFKVGDVVSYRVTGSLEGMPFVGTLLEVHADHVIISPGESDPLARISQGVRCIGAPDMIILFWNREMVIRGGVPRCRQSVAQRHTDLHA